MKNWLVLIITALFLIFACSDEQLPPKINEQPVKVQAETAVLKQDFSFRTYSATVEPINRMRLSTRISGWIEAINFKEGQAIPKSAVVVQLSNEDIKAKIAQSEAQVQSAEINFENVEKNHQRIVNLFEKKAATQKEMDDSYSALINARSQLDMARQSKIEAQEMMRYSKIRAPYRGVLTRKFMDVGDLVNPGQIILEIEDTRKVKIVAKIPEKEIGRLEKGTQVEVLIESIENNSGSGLFAGTIDQILPAADPVSRKFDIQIIIENQQQLIKSGTFARVKIPGYGEKSVIAPKEALFKRGQLEGLFIIDNENIARLRWIRSGKKSADHVEILSGLNAGERVVTAGKQNLTDGQSVEIE